jgi:hypothetical protein
MLQDNNFSHIFKRVESEFLLTTEDGDFVNMECTTWLDLSNEMEKTISSEPEWETDLHQIKSIERNDMVPLLPINDSLADQLL